MKNIRKCADIQLLSVRLKDDSTKEKELKKTVTYGKH